jgi:hypothetical protein
MVALLGGDIVSNAFGQPLGGGRRIPPRQLTS